MTEDSIINRRTRGRTRGKKKEKETHLDPEVVLVCAYCPRRMPTIIYVDVWLVNAYHEHVYVYVL